MEFNEQDVKALREGVESIKGIAEKFPTLEADIAAVKDAVGEIDVKELAKRVEKSAAQHDAFVRRIRNHEGGLHVPGLADEAEGKFSIHKTACAVASKNWKNAGFEKECLDAVRDVMEKTGQRMGVDSDGGYFVPDQIIPEVIGAIYRDSVFIALNGNGQTRVSVLDGLIGNPVKIPAFEGGMVAYWQGENDKYVESMVKTGNISMVPKKLTVLAKLTEEMRKFSSFGFENLMRNDMIRALAAELDRTVPYGAGNTDEPRGLLNMDIGTDARDIQWYSAEDGTVRTSKPADSGGGELDFDGLLEMQGALEDANIAPNASFATISAPRYFRRIKKLKVDNYSAQTTNRPYILNAPMISDARLAEIIGEFGKSTMVPTSNLPGASASWPTTSTDEKFGDVLMGNWNEIMLARWAGIEIVNDAGMGLGFPTDTIFVKMRMWADIQKRQGKAIVVCPDAQMRD